MQKILLYFLCSGIIVLCLAQSKKIRPDPGQQFADAEQLFRQAHDLAERAGDDSLILQRSDTLYQATLHAFIKFLSTTADTGNDSLRFIALTRTGFLHHYFFDPVAAKKDYLEAIGLKKIVPVIADSLLLFPLIYTGGIYYDEGQFDSAFYFYKQAEQINDQAARPIDGAARLYNRLGAMYYETGDYRRARNYFEKAITLLQPGETDLSINYRINIASLLVKLEDYETAKKLYLDLLPSPYENEIFHNLGVIHIRQGDYIQGIKFLERVQYENNKKTIDLEHHFAIAYSALGEEERAQQHLQKALDANRKWNGARKNVQYGALLIYQGDERLKKERFSEAISFYQQAIVQFHPQFNSTAVQNNPGDFSGVFSYMNLFNALNAKARTLGQQYSKEKKIHLLESSLATYHSAFELAAYVEKTYNSDEARLFLGQIKHAIHHHPIDIAISLFELTKEKKYLEEAYWLDQQNKASVLSLNIRENDLQAETATNDQLSKQEIALKTTITRLSLQASRTTDSISLSAIYADIRDNEIHLDKVRESIASDPLLQARSTVQQVPSINEVQKKLDAKTAILSFHLSDIELLSLVISKQHFVYHRIPVDSQFFAAIDSFKLALHDLSGHSSVSGISEYLYNKIMQPNAKELDGITRLVIIPDDELHYLSFEALQSPDKKYLVENYATQYQYSTSLLWANRKIKASRGTLSFAPFSRKGFKESDSVSFSALPASKQEIEGLDGRSFTDVQATKAAFLQHVNKNGTVHLATHASIDNRDPYRSYIAFYPDNPDNKLYAREISDMRLDSTKLIILSACETGSGQLVKGEGLMSLSRAFAYAGCPDIITSLWKAEDKATSFITRRLHYYLDKNYSHDRALQMAKLDLLKTDELSPRFKSPNYWAHLVFIGTYHSLSKNRSRAWLVLAVPAMLLAWFIFKRKNLSTVGKQARFS